MMYTVFSLITDLSEPTSAMRICWDTNLNISIVLHSLRLGLMIQTLVKYIQRCLEKYRCEDVINDFQTLTTFCQRQLEDEDLRNEIIHLYSSLVTKIERIQLEVDKSLGQFFTESVPWSPTVQVHRNHIDYWHRVLCIKTGVLTSKNAIKKLSIKLREYSGHYLTALACLNKLKTA